MDELKQFKYDQLPSTAGVRTIRLLELKPGNPGDVLKCSITTTSLASATNYEAISYCWGSYEKVDSIICDDRGAIPLNQSLGLALRYFRHPERSRTLWADAICINQSDVEEKSIQVRQMRDVFKRAQRVLVWLGEEVEGESIEPLISLSQKMATMDLASLPEGRIARQDAVGFNRVHILALTYLLDMPWFRRVWIVQEVAVSREAILFCGYKSIDWSDLCLIVQLEDGMTLMGVNNQVVMDIVTGIDLERTAMREKIPTTLLQALLRHRMSLASDNRDKIFALLGICRNENLKADYHLSSEEVYKRFTTSYMCQHRSLDIITAPSGPIARRPSGMPSWVPDWSAVDVAFPLALRTQLFPEMDYQATLNSKWTPAFSEDGNILRVEAQFLDEVDVLGVVRKPFRPKKLDMNALFRQMQSDFNTSASWYRICLKHAKNWDDLYAPTGEALFDACWQLFMAGCSPAEYEQCRRQCERVWTVYRVYTLAARLHLLPLWALKMKHQVSKLAGRRLSKAQRIIDEAQENDLQFRVRRAVSHRRVMRTRQGYLGLAPATTQVEDRVVLIKGMRAPAILRPCNQGWELIGDCNVHGCMNGEAFQPDLCEEVLLV
ncbi:heterokaryon incompatibility protein-domain-containing protein [Xylaria sp. FL0064]|nr:heterokaryon incompatibility protein-domain-containing protein [Xylaria sp. FL0064]